MMIPLLLQIGGAVPSTHVELLTNATPMTRVVLGILLILSLISWAAMFASSRQITRSMTAGRGMLREVERATRLDDVSAAVRVAPPSGFTRLFTHGMRFISDVRVQEQQQLERSSGESTARAAATLTGSQIETLHLILETEAMTERDRLGRFLPWLATIGSASPLLGLFGTVLGVIDAFVGIAREGSGNLAAVAPGVAEALIATAAALAVAIPATFAYNILANRLNRVDALFEGFSTALIALLVREGHI
jgi:biopolymer transport protein TolQ